MNKKMLIVVSALSILVISIMFFYAGKEEVQKAVPIIDRLPAEKRPASERVLKPAKPEDYGMVVFNSSDDFLNESEIDALMRDKLREIKKKFPKETLEKANKVIKEDPQRTKEKINRIEEEIAKCRKILKDQPYNEEAKIKLRNLFMLKSIGREMQQE